MNTYRVLHHQMNPKRFTTATLLSASVQTHCPSCWLWMSVCRIYTVVFVAVFLFFLFSFFFSSSFYALFLLGFWGGFGVFFGLFLVVFFNLFCCCCFCFLISSTWLQMMMSWCLMSSDVSWHIRDKLWPIPKHGSIILYVHGNQKAR